MRFSTESFKVSDVGRRVKTNSALHSSGEELESVAAGASYRGGHISHTTDHTLGQDIRFQELPENSPHAHTKGRSGEKSHDGPIFL
jgi:hypothetical protein